MADDVFDVAQFRGDVRILVHGFVCRDAAFADLPAPRRVPFGVFPSMPVARRSFKSEMKPRPENQAHARPFMFLNSHR